MKYMIASDLHGSAAWCKRMLDCFELEKADRLVLLGDLLYHGPRNDLPDEYAPKKVIVMLSEYKDRILCVRGNCDAYVDQMVLPFPVLADYAVLMEQSHMIYLTHGHLYHKDAMPPMMPGDVLLYGHTHVPMMQQVNERICMNPGSVSMPKESSWHGYMTLQDGRFLWKDMDGTEHMTYTLK